MRIKPSLLFIPLFVFIISFGSCKREVIEFTEPDTGYFPLDSGTYADYEVTYVLYNDFERTVDTFVYYLRETVGKTETDNLGNPYSRIERYTRDNRIITISFPTHENKEWDGLVYIRKDTTVAIPGGTIDLYKDWSNFKIISSDKSEIIGGISYDSVLTVLRADKINNIERRYSLEKYAKKIGLVMRRDSILDTQCGGNIATCINTPWALKAEKGFILNMKLIATNR